MKKLSCLLTLAMCGSVAGWSVRTPAQDLGGGRLKENLDLPYDAAGQDTEEEDAPETIFFYGQTYEGDGFFFTVDHSGSMNDKGELAVAKREIIRNIIELSDRAEFSINFFDMNVKKFPAGGRPAQANQGMKSGARSFVQTIGRGSGSCCREGLLAALQSANLSAAPRKVIIYVGDGGGTCSRSGLAESEYHRSAMSQVRQQNIHQAQVNTVGVLMGANNRPDREQFLRQISTSNGGTYKRVN